MKFTVRWPDSDELLNQAQEEALAAIDGAVSLEVNGFERIGPLTRRYFDVIGVDGRCIGKITIDIYPEKDEQIAEVTAEEVTLSPLQRVYSSREAARLWGLSENTVTQWCNRGKFLPSEARKSEKVWLVTHAGMVRLTGRDPK